MRVERKLVSVLHMGSTGDHISGQFVFEDYEEIVILHFPADGVAFSMFSMLANKPSYFEDKAMTISYDDETGKIIDVYS